MGAYENPPMIQTPNYGEIFSRNVQNLITVGEEKKKEKETKFLAAGERKTEYARRAGNIKAGALTENINNIGLGLTDSYSENENLFAQGKISAEEYANNKSKYETALNTLSTAGATIREFGEAIKDMDLSSYQENGELIALVDAYKRGALDAQIVDGQVELHYEAPDGSIIQVDEKWLSNQDSWNLNEKFDSDQITTDLASIVEKQINTEVTNKTTTDAGVVMSSEERYSQAYGTEQKRLDQIMQNKVVSGLDRQELGSYYMDKVSSNIDANSDADLNAVLNAQNLTEEQKQQIKEDVSKGQWSNRDFESVNSGDILREVAKRKLAREVLEKVRPPKKSVQTAEDQTTSDFDTELAKYTDTSSTQQLENIKMLRQTVEDNKYGYQVKDGFGYVTQNDEEGNPTLVEKFNLKDPYEVSKALVKIKYGKDTKESRKLIDEITRVQVNAPEPETVKTPTPDLEGFEQGTTIKEVSFNVGKKSYNLSTSTQDAMTVDEASKQMRISGVIPKALEEKGIPITRENINIIRDAINKTGASLNTVLNSIPKAEMLNTEVEVSNRKQLP